MHKYLFSEELIPHCPGFPKMEQYQPPISVSELVSPEKIER